MKLETLKDWYAEKSWNRPRWQVRQALRMADEVMSRFRLHLEENSPGLNLLAFLDREDRAQFLASGIDVAWVSLEGDVESSYVQETVFEAPRGVVGFHVLEFEDKFRHHYTRTRAQLVDLASSRLLMEFRDKIEGLRQALPDAPLSVVVFGSMLSKSFLEPDQWYWHCLGRVDVGMVAGPLSFWTPEIHV